jgi:hypothetical protein
MNHSQVREALNTPVKTIQERYRSDSKEGNDLLRERGLLSQKTGLNQKEIGEMTIEDFVHLLHFHKIGTNCDC